MQQHPSMRAYAQELMQRVDHTDADGRNIGLDYDQIRAMVLRAFPRVTCHNKHFGKPSKCGIKEMHEMACELNRQGVRMPFRPRRKRGSKQ